MCESSQNQTQSSFKVKLVAQAGFFSLEHRMLANFPPFQTVFISFDFFGTIIETLKKELGLFLPEFRISLFLSDFFVQ